MKFCTRVINKKNGGGGYESAIAPINLHKHRMTESVFSEATVSMWMALLDKHVNKAS